MLELSDRSRWLVGAVASTAAVSLWLARRRQFSAAVQAPGEPLSTSFEAYLKQAPPEPVQYATTSFEAYLKQPPTAAAAAAAAAAPSSIADSLQAPPSAKPVTILFGTEYGFSKEVAERAGEALAAVDGGAAFWPQLLDMADLEGGLPSLASCQALLLVCSTQGDGVPPTEARPFCDWLASAAAPQLAATPFSVCALGDKSYQHFCRCGRTLDARLEALGGKRLAARADINREDFAAIDGWVESVCSALATLPLKTLAELGGTAALAAPAAEGGAAPAKRWSRSRPYMGRLVAVEGLCRLVSADDKNTVRVEVDLGDSGLQYLPGDALGIWPSNCPEAVDELLEVMGVDGKLQVQVPCWHYDDAVLPANATSMPLRDALARCYDLRQPKPELLHLLHARLAALHTQQQEQHAPLGTNSSIGGSDGGSAGLAKGGHGKPGRLGQHHVKDKDSASELSGSDAAAATQGELCAQGCIVDRLERLAALVADPEAAEAYLRPRHLVDVLADCGGLPLGLGAAELLCTLRQLQPRLYSISSSQLEHPQRVQATIALVHYDSLGAGRIGVCSTFIGERLEEGQQVPVYIHKNPDFRLPADPATPIIMVGPGTGLAPFRSFMQDRLLRAQEGGAPPCGPCLLYFGCRRRDQDYLYGQQLEEWAAQGKLTLFTAFSREQAEKVYVQDRLAQSGPQVWDLLEHAGAHFYVCGDAGSMAGAVERQLLAIIEQGQGQGREAAQAYLQRLSDSGRYQRDVWLS